MTTCLKSLNGLAPAYLTSLLSCMLHRDLHAMVTSNFTSFILDPETPEKRRCQSLNNITTVRTADYSCLTQVRIH